MSRVIDAIFRLTDEFSTPLKTIQTALTDVGREGRSARRQIEKAGQGITNVGKGLTASVTVPLLAAGTSAVTYAGEVSQSMSLAKATIGDANLSMGEWEAAERAAMDAAAEHIFTMQDASDATLNFARQGYDGAGIANLMGAAMDYAQGTGSDLATTAEGIGNILKGFDEEATLQNVTTHFDEMARAQAMANTNGTELLTGVQMMAPTMRTLGYDVADSATLIAAWGDSGVSASEGATAWKTSMARLAKPTKDVQTAMDALNFSMFDEAGNAKDLVTVQAELNASFSGLSAQEKEAYASMMFGKNQMSKMLMIVDTAPEKFAAMNAGIREGDITSQGLSQSMGESLGGSIESLKSSIDVLSYSFGQLIGEYAEPVIRKVTEMVDWFRNLDTATKDQIVRFAGIAAAVGPALIAFGKFVSFGAKIMRFTATISKAGGLLKAAFAAITSPAGVVIAVLAGIVAAGILVYKNWDTIKEKCAPVFEALQTAVTELKPHFDAFKEALSALGETLAPVAEAIKNTLATAFGTLATAVGQSLANKIGLLSQKLKKVLDTGTNLINFINNVFKKDWGAAWEDIKTKFDTFFGPIAGVIQGVIDKVTGLKESVKGGIDWSVFNPLTYFGGGKGGADNAPQVATNASGTSYWRGGLTSINESGGEIVDLPQGTRIIPHDATRNIVNNMGGRSVTIPKLADQIIVREDADIDRIVDGICRKLIRAGDNMGAVSMA